MWTFVSPSIALTIWHDIGVTYLIWTKDFLRPRRQCLRVRQLQSQSGVNAALHVRILQRLLSDQQRRVHLQSATTTIEWSGVANSGNSIAPKGTLVNYGTLIFQATQLASPTTPYGPAQVAATGSWKELINYGTGPLQLSLLHEFFLTRACRTR